MNISQKNTTPPDRSGFQMWSARHVFLVPCKTLSTNVYVERKLFPDQGFAGVLKYKPSPKKTTYMRALGKGHRKSELQKIQCVDFKVVSMK